MAYSPATLQYMQQSQGQSQPTAQYRGTAAPDTLINKPQTALSVGGTPPPQGFYNIAGGRQLSWGKGVPINPATGNRYQQGAGGQWYDPADPSTYINTQQPQQGVTAGNQFPGGGGMGGGSRGGMGGAPTGPYQAFGSGTPQTLAQGRDMMFRGTIDPWRNFYMNDPRYQSAKSNLFNTAQGMNPINLDPLRAEQADIAAGSHAALMRAGHQTANQTGVNFTPMQQWQAAAGIRQGLGTNLRGIGFDERMGNMQRQDAARDAYMQLPGMELSNAVSPANLARLDGLSKLESYTSSPYSYGTGTL